MPQRPRRFARLSVHPSRFFSSPLSIAALLATLAPALVGCEITSDAEAGPQGAGGANAGSVVAPGAPGTTPGTGTGAGNGADGAATTDDGGVSTAADGGPTNDGAVSTPAPAVVSLGPCVASGKGIDYAVGPGAGQIASLDQVPWESLKAGDTVRIHYRAAPYAGKFMISGVGTASAPIRVCGVRGPNGERPVIDGNGATTRAALLNQYGSKAFDQEVHQGRTVVLVKHDPAKGYMTFPDYIQIDGLAIRRGHPSYTFKDAAGATKTYADFGACIWVERGHHVTIADNEVSDCNHAIFTKSTDEGDFAVTRDLRIAGNDFFGNGVAGSYTIHTSYVQGVNVVYELNRYGAMRAGAAGNSIKDRSVGTVIRYNRIEDGARAIDLVEAEDFPATAKADPAYRTTFVYGNTITKDGEKGSTIHYGGDHAGSEANYRKGTLYFFHNTVHLTGNGYGVLFQLSTTEEKAEVWNNVFVFDAAIPYPSMRAGQENDVGYTAGGIVNLGKNWIDSRWADSDPFHPIPGQLNGASNMITGTGSPVDLTTFAPKAGSAVLDVAQANPAAVSGHPVSMQLDANGAGVARTVKGAAADLGAVER